MPHRPLLWHRFAVAFSAVALAAAGCKPHGHGATAPTPTPGVTAVPAGFSTNPYCTTGVLCSTLPQDILPTPGCDMANQQCSRDFWSWQTFVSLNWPGTVTGDKVVRPDPRLPVSGPGNRVWELWMDPDSVFLPNAVTPVWTPDQSLPHPCAAGSSGRAIVGRLAKASVALGKVDPNNFFEATIHQPLIDQNLEFVLFEIRMSQKEVEWVVTNNLYQQEAVNALKTSLQFPDDAIEAKAAWRILPASMPAAQKARYYREAATIILDPQHVEGGGTGPVCISRELGLVGLHIRSGRNGFWSTFEQIDNVTANGPGFQPTFNNPACPTCKVNFPPTYPGGRPIFSDEYKWKLNGPSAGLYKGFPNVPAQIARAPHQDEYINKVLNAWWQQSVLKGTVWANYMLITTNWIELASSQPSPALNTALEPYIPRATQFPQTCIECHRMAKNGNNAALGESFMPFRACPKKPMPGQTLPPNCVLGAVDTLATHN
ncbi:MAG TPA: hypothetical protein VFS60_03630 [Thermoanaerobaculia bacterium]|nr:hypothetical protein [Thermoanaerobaculia bacterium]